MQDSDCGLEINKVFPSDLSGLNSVRCFCYMHAQGISPNKMSFTQVIAWNFQLRDLAE